MSSWIGIEAKTGLGPGRGRSPAAAQAEPACQCHVLQGRRGPGVPASLILIQ